MSATTLPAANPFGLTPRALRVGDRVRFFDPIFAPDPRKNLPAGQEGTVMAIYPGDDVEYRVDLDNGSRTLLPHPEWHYIVELIRPTHRSETVSTSPFEPPVTREVRIPDPDEDCES